MEQRTYAADITRPMNTEPNELLISSWSAGVIGLLLFDDI